MRSLQGRRRQRQEGTQPGEPSGYGHVLSPIGCRAGSSRGLLCRKVALRGYWESASRREERIYHELRAGRVSEPARRTVGLAIRRNALRSSRLRSALDDLVHKRATRGTSTNGHHDGRSRTRDPMSKHSRSWDGPCRPWKRCGAIRLPLERAGRAASGACRCRQARTSWRAWSSCCRPMSAAGWTPFPATRTSAASSSRMALCACFWHITCGSTARDLVFARRQPRQAAPGRTVRARVQSDPLGRAGADRAFLPRRGGCRRREPRSQALRSAAHRPPGAVRAGAGMACRDGGAFASGRLPAVVGLQGSGVQSCGRGLHDRLCQHPHRAGPALAWAAAGSATPPAAAGGCTSSRPARAMSVRWRWRLRRRAG